MSTSPIGRSPSGERFRPYFVHFVVSVLFGSILGLVVGLVSWIFIDGRNALITGLVAAVILIFVIGLRNVTLLARLRQRPQTAEDHFKRAIAFYEALNDTDSALQDLCRALEIEPDYFEALLYRSNLLASASPADAARDLELASEIDRRRPKTKSELANLVGATPQHKLRDEWNSLLRRCEKGGDEETEAVCLEWLLEFPTHAISAKGEADFFVSIAARGLGMRRADLVEKALERLKTKGLAGLREELDGVRMDTPSFSKGVRQASKEWNLKDYEQVAAQVAEQLTELRAGKPTPTGSGEPTTSDDRQLVT